VEAQVACEQVLAQVAAQVATQVELHVDWLQVFVHVSTQVETQVVPQVVWLQVGPQVISHVMKLPSPPPLSSMPLPGSFPLICSVVPFKDAANSGEFPVSLMTCPVGQK
jgi:hypothetical protein